MAQIDQAKRLVLTQQCNRRSIRANVNKASKQAKQGECLPCEFLVQGKRKKEESSASCHFIALKVNLNLQYFYLIEIWKMYQKYLEYLRRVLVTIRLTDSFLRCRERKEMLRKNFGTCSLVRLKERERIHLGIRELT